MDSDEENKKSVSSSEKTGKLPDHLELMRTRVIMNNEAANQTSTTQYSGAFVASGVDNSLQFDDFTKNFRVDVKSLSEDFMEFDIVGIDPAIANAFRRILIAEVPTMAIEKVFFADNTSLIQDEVLAHRLGLVPLKVDPRLFQFRGEGEMALEDNTVVFKLKAKCKRKAKGSDEIEGSRVLSGNFEWLPEGSHWPPESEKKFTGFSENQKVAIDFGGKFPRPTNEDIVLARLRPGQAIELEAHAVKGLGKTHSKWSPVATASYKMLPEVHFLKPMEGELADSVVETCPVGVFDIEDLGKGKRRARAANPRKCTLCRECVRPEGWDKYIQLRRVKNHFIFSIESTGALPPDVLFTEAVQILQNKVDMVAAELA